MLSGYQRNRLRAFLDPSLDPQGIGYQTRQVRIAIGSGGLGGQGLFEGRQTQGGFIPFQETDFVFSVAGEELGFLGAAGLVVLIGFIVVRCVVVARRADAFGRLVAIGVAVWLGVQAFENIGMNLGLMPVTGLPLPFVSSGGSSLIASWIAVGLVGNVAVGVAPGRARALGSDVHPGHPDPGRAPRLGRVSPLSRPGDGRSRHDAERGPGATAGVPRPVPRPGVTAGATAGVTARCHGPGSAQGAALRRAAGSRSAVGWPRLRQSRLHCCQVCQLTRAPVTVAVRP